MIVGGAACADRRGGGGASPLAASLVTPVGGGVWGSSASEAMSSCLEGMGAKYTRSTPFIRGLTGGGHAYGRRRRVRQPTAVHAVIPKPAGSGTAAAAAIAAAQSAPNAAPVTSGRSAPWTPLVLYACAINARSLKSTF